MSTSNRNQRSNKSSQYRKNNHQSNGNIVSSTTNKKVDEVKEVIQNKPDAEIVKVLEYFDNDVGKTIDAFVNDGGKEALLKWHDAKASKRLSQHKATDHYFNDNNHNIINN